MRKLWAALICALLTACQADDSISRNYRCSFIFDTSLHPLPCQLTGILGNSGHFMKVRTSVRQGVRYLHTTRNFDNATEDIALSTARETQFNYYLGANDCIIIGTNTYDFQLVAYDGQCPNCLADYNGFNYPLTWQDNGKLLYCAKCKRSYDVNNGVIASGEPGKHSLLKYMAALDGAVIRVWN